MLEVDTWQTDLATCWGGHACSRQIQESVYWVWGLHVGYTTGASSQVRNKRCKVVSMPQFPWFRVWKAGPWYTEHTRVKDLLGLGYWFLHIAFTCCPTSDMNLLMMFDTSGKFLISAIKCSLFYMRPC